jgi:hypothetical protein
MITKFHASDFDRALIKLREYILPGASYVLEINKSKSIRSLNQNRYYFGVVLLILSDHFGYTTDELHQICAGTFLRYENKGKEFVKSTTKLDTKEFEIYLEQIRRWAMNEHQISIPLPNEVTEEVYIELQRKYNYL